ncbi:MAG: hypothetical protein LBL07_10370 [Tannerella sp.]|jgi:hypothetical protein|nr:hypothetical protein [Tannerella sp.]
MKLKEFKKLFKGLPADTEIMLVADWTVTGVNGAPLLCDANRIEIACDEPQGIGDEGREYAYIFNDPDYGND